MNKKDRESLKKRISNEDDFIYCPRLGNSLDTLIKKNPNGVDNARISKVLLIDEEEVESTFNNAIAKLRKLLGVTE